MVFIISYPNLKGLSDVWSIKWCVGLFIVVGVLWLILETFVIILLLQGTLFTNAYELSSLGLRAFAMLHIMTALDVVHLVITSNTTYVYVSMVTANFPAVLDHDFFHFAASHVHIWLFYHFKIRMV